MELHRVWQRAPPSSADFQNHGPRLLVTAILLMSITLLVVCGRVYCRAFLLKRMGIDDWCMILATVGDLLTDQLAGSVVLILRRSQLYLYLSPTASVRAPN